MVPVDSGRSTPVSVSSGSEEPYSSDSENELELDVEKTHPGLMKQLEQEEAACGCDRKWIHCKSKSFAVKVFAGLCQIPLKLLRNRVVAIARFVISVAATALNFVRIFFPLFETHTTLRDRAWRCVASLAAAGFTFRQLAYYGKQQARLEHITALPRLLLFNEVANSGTSTEDLLDGATFSKTKTERTYHKIDSKGLAEVSAKRIFTGLFYCCVNKDPYLGTVFLKERPASK